MYGSCSGMSGNVRRVGKPSAPVPTLSGLPIGAVNTGSLAGVGGGPCAAALDAHNVSAAVVATNIRTISPPPGRKGERLDHASVRAQDLAVDPATVRAGQEGHDAGDVLGHAEALQGRLGCEA